MSSGSDYSANAALACHRILGLDPESHATKQVNVSRQKLKKAIEKAYQLGKREKTEPNNGVDTQLLFCQLMDSLPDNVYFKDRNSRFTQVNMAQAAFLGLDNADDAIGKSDFDYFDENEAAKRFASEQEIMRIGKGWELHEEIDMKSTKGRICIIASKSPLYDKEGKTIGTFGISRNVTTRYLAEREIERQRKLLDTIIQILPCRMFARDTKERFIMINDAYCKSVGYKDRKSLIGKKLSEVYDPKVYDMINRQDQLIMSKKRPELKQVYKDLVASDKQRWVVASKVPLLSPDKGVDGIVGMIYDITKQKEAEEKAHELSNELLRKNEQFEAELLVARQLQETLMSMGFDEKRSYSKFGSNWNINASYYYKPSHHLAGDFFDLIPISKNKLGFLVCDVMGHGVKASLVTMLLRGLILEMSDYLDQPGRVLSQLNASLCSLAEGPEFPRFVTAVYMTIDLEKGEARIANAGHPTPLWKSIDEDGKESFHPCPSKEPGPALGIIEGETFERHTFQLSGVTELLFYTDGIIEQKDAMGNEFGIQKLEDILLNNERISLSSQLDTIELALRLTAGAKEFDDDICIVAVKLEPKPRQ